MKAPYMAFLAIIVWFALGLQFYISTVKYMADGRTFGGAIVQLLSYFTIQNNILIALSLSVILLWPASVWAKFFLKFETLAAMSLYITIVGLVYQLILRQQGTKYGLFKLADEIFHSVSPVLFILFWLFFIPKGNLQWSKAFTWLIYPLIYLIYVLIRGAVSGFYPYNFIDANLISYQQMAINAMLLLFAFLAVGTFFIAIDRFLKKETILHHHIK